MNLWARVTRRLATRLVRGLPAGVVAGAVGVTLAIAGCSTVVDRIDEHADLFESLDRQTQAALLAGKAEIGHTMDMAYIAFGAPSEIRRQQTENGNAIIWLYQYPDPVYHHGHFHHDLSTFNHHLDGYHYFPFHPYYLDYVYRDYRRITFVDGRITSIEEVE